MVLVIRSLSELIPPNNNNNLVIGGVIPGVGDNPSRKACIAKRLKYHQKLPQTSGKGHNKVIKKYIKTSYTVTTK
jgi:site-specific recombinase